MKRDIFQFDVQTHLEVKVKQLLGSYTIFDNALIWIP
jgi:hypothetical protein